MFADACEKAMKFTKPVLTFTRTIDGNTHSSVGSFTVINNEGWIITSGHIFDSLSKYKNDQNKIKETIEFNKELQNSGNTSEDPHEFDPSWITNHSFWWSWSGVRITNVFIDRQLDFVVGKLEPFDSNWVGEYPTFRDPSTMKIGTSLCRLGFPFTSVDNDFDSKTNAFNIKPGTLPLQPFPNDGIHTRNILKDHNDDDNYDLLYVETSTPGLKGQSGGPIFDKEGNLYAMQTQTQNLPLGFQPSAEIDGKRVIEYQFMNIGLGVHIKSIMRILDINGVKYRVQGDESGYRIVD